MYHKTGKRRYIIKKVDKDSGFGVSGFYNSICRLIELMYEEKTNDRGIHVFGASEQNIILFMDKNPIGIYNDWEISPQWPAKGENRRNLPKYSINIITGKCRVKVDAK